MSFLADAVKLFKATIDSGINISALITILILVYFAWRGIYKENSRFSQYAKHAPSILATVGIFFSFLGIALALISFDTNNIDGSIPNLLNGLKSKFIASLMGMSASIVVKIMQVLKVKNNSNIILDGEKEIVNLLSDIKIALLQSNKINHINLLPEFKKQTILLDSIRNSLIGDGESSIITQLKLVKLEISSVESGSKKIFDDTHKYNHRYLSTLNKTIQDGFTNQVSKFDDFANILAENNAKAFIKSLEKAMSDFNNNLTEQFGDNFKELNKAVGELLKWQENYKVHVEKLQENFQITLDSVKIIKRSFGDIQSRSEKFTVISENLHIILEGLDGQLKDLNNHLKAFDALASNAKDAFPHIEDNLTKLTSGFKNSTEQSLFVITDTVTSMRENLLDTTLTMRNAMNEQKDALTSTSQDFKTVTKNLTKETKESIDNYRDSLQQTIHNYERELQKVVQDQMSHVGNAIKSSSEQFNKLLIENTTKSTGILEQQTDRLDHALQEELRKSIETMGKHLAALSKKFVDDYSPLTDKLREVIELAEDLKKPS
jgi:ABC-type transporter Mla subunit MlaD